MIMSKKKVLLWVLLCCICISCTIGYLRLQASAAVAEIVDCELPPEFEFGDNFVMPDGKVSYKGQEKTPDSKYVLFPSGKAQGGEAIALSETGKYELVFSASFDGATITARKSFLVKKPILQVDHDSSSAQIVDGKIKVSLAPDDVFTYNAVLDLSAASKELPLLDIEFNPSVIGTADATRVRICLTDLYNEENYVTICLNHFTDSWATGHIYVTAGAAGLPQVGVENAGNPDAVNVHVDDSYGYGAAINCAMSGLPNAPADTHLTMYYDHNEKAFYGDRESYSGTNQLIADLDDPTLVGDELWAGFTTGQVKMTVYASNYQASTCNFTISTINGIKEFSDVGDTYAPIVSVHTGYELEEIPTALVGKPYSVFDAEAIDGHDGIIETITSVYYKYYSEKPVKVDLRDGKFIPSKEGVYVIEYKAEDRSGNETVECVSVNAVKGDGLQVELLDVVTQTDTGTPITLISGIEYEDASGDVSYRIQAKNTSTGEEQEVDIQSHRFIPMTDGEWEITVTVQDYVSTVVKTFTVNANHTVQPHVYDTVAVQDYFIVGAAYQLPELSAYDFSSGTGVLAPMDIFVTEQGSEEKRIENGRYIPEKTGSVVLTYRMTVEGESCEKIYTATAVDVGYNGELDLSKFFVPSTADIHVLADTTFINYEINKNTKLDFVNFVQTKQMAFSFQVGDKNAYDQVHVYLTDTVTGKQVKFTFRRTENGAMFSVNGGAEKALSSSFDGINKNFYLEFNNDTRLVSPEASIELDVKKFLDGTEFTGFTNSVARFSVEVSGVSGPSDFLIKNLNGHTFNNSKTDRFAPQLIVETKSGDRGKGEKVVLNGAFAYDTLDTICILTLDVTGPNGEYIKDENGVLMDGTQDATKDYTLVLDEYGDYVIRYSIKDSNGKSDYYVYSVSAKDVTGPTITLRKHKESAKKGDTVKVAGADVTDNISEECTVEAYVFNPKGESVKTTEGEFKATMSGVYTVRYIAFDESGNCAFAFYKINVK